MMFKHRFRILRDHLKSKSKRALLTLDPDLMHEIGRNYFDGAHTPVRTHYAFFWWSLSAWYGHKGAKKELQAYGSQDLNPFHGQPLPVTDEQWERYLQDHHPGDWQWEQMYLRALRHLRILGILTLGRHSIYRLHRWLLR